QRRSIHANGRRPCRKPAAKAGRRSQETGPVHDGSGYGLQVCRLTSRAWRYAARPPLHNLYKSLTNNLPTLPPRIRSLVMTEEVGHQAFGVHATVADNAVVFAEATATWQGRSFPRPCHLSCEANLQPGVEILEFSCDWDRRSVRASHPRAVRYQDKL